MAASGEHTAAAAATHLQLLGRTCCLGPQCRWFLPGCPCCTKPGGAAQSPWTHRCYKAATHLRLPQPYLLLQIPGVDAAAVAACVQQLAVLAETRACDLIHVCRLHGIQRQAP
eukprot:886680-Pelagomonas_calceolata.AAC.3